MTNEQGNGDAPEAAEDKSSDNNNDDILSSIEDEDIREQVSKKLTGLQEQKKHWRTKAEKAENASEEKEQNDNDKQEESAEDVSKVSERIDRLEQNQKLARDGYSDDEIAEARAYAKGKDMDVTEAIESEFVQSAIQSMRSKKKSQQGTPRPSQRTHVKDDKTFNDVIKDEEASKSEKDAALQEYVKQRAGKDGRQDYS